MYNLTKKAHPSVAHEHHNSTLNQTNLQIFQDAHLPEGNVIFPKVYDQYMLPILKKLLDYQIISELQTFQIQFFKLSAKYYDLTKLEGVTAKILIKHGMGSYF